MEPNAATGTNGSISIGIAGAGLIGRRHVDLVRRSSRTHLAGIADPDPRANDLGVHRFDSLDELLAAGRPDGVIVATPSALHLEHGLAAIAAGVPVLVEKPIATSVDDGLRLARAADDAGVPLLVGHHRRHSPLLAAAHQVVARGDLGAIVALTAWTMFAKPAEYFEAAPWRREPGGGPILINLIHDIDSLRMLLGDVVAVAAMASGLVRRHPVEETVAVSMRFAGGTLGALMLSDAAASPLSWELTSGEDPAYPRQKGLDCYVIAGTAGSLGIPTMRLTQSDGRADWREPMRASVIRVEAADPLERQLHHFCDVVRRVAEPAVTAADATESLRVTLAVAEAARTGRQVDCRPPP